MSELKPIGKWLRLVIVASGLTMLLGGSYAAWHYFDVPPLDRYAPLIARMASHQVQGDDRGIVDLSKTYPGLTPRDTAYIRWRSDGTFAAMFPTFYGQGAEIAGLVYTSRPLREEDTQPHEGYLNFEQRVIGVGTYDYLVLDKRINPNWYHVSYHLH